MSHGAESISVLCVDDEPGLADLTATFLERFDGDLATSTAESAQEGLDHLDGNHVDCVVSEVVSCPTGRQRRSIGCGTDHLVVEFREPCAKRRSDRRQVAPDTDNLVPGIDGGLRFRDAVSDPSDRDVSVEAGLTRAVYRRRHLLGTLF